MCYNSDYHTVRYGALFISSAEVSIAYHYWANRPVLLDYRPADCVITSASNTGRFVMSAKDGKPCKKCGSNEWYIDGKCAVCKRESYRLWSINNKEKCAERNRRWQRENPERKSASNRQWRERNPEKHAAATRRWNKNNPEKRVAYTRQWQIKNPEKAAALVHRRDTAKTKAGGSYTAAEWKTLCDHYGNKCLACGRTDVALTVDHVIPISKGGTSNIDNLQPLCGSCNSSKRDKAIDYRPDKGLGRWIQKKLFG